MFERFTDPARQVVVFAQDEARALRHNYVGTEHILLGLLREAEGLAAGVLDALGVSLEDVRRQVVRVVGSGEGEVVTGEIPFTPRAKKVLELSLREALSLGHNHIGTEHLLLGLARENEGVAAQILVGLGVDAHRLRREVVHMLLDSPTRPHGDGAAGRQRSRAPIPAVDRARERRDWLPVVAAGVWSLFGLGVGVLLGRRFGR